MKYRLHAGPDRFVVCVDRSGIVWAARGSEFLSGGKQRFDGFVSENDQCGDRPQTFRDGLIPASAADAADDLFAAQFLQIISGTGGGRTGIGSVYPEP